MWRVWMNGIIGIWLFSATFLNFSANTNSLNNIIVGSIAIIIGLTFIKDKPWQGWLTGSVGIWLIISAFIPVLIIGIGNEENAVICEILLMVAGFGTISAPSHSHIAFHSH